ncbi:MAG: hypothetical protein HQK83_13450 [Fibrobacteria bacterium]|nr:hypothetical protein [Fibrobacteria bacterium]
MALLNKIQMSLVILLLLVVVAFSQDDKKVVYINLDVDNAELNDLPFFSGLVIEEPLEKPNEEFEIAHEPPPTHEVTMDPGIRKIITQLKRVNTIKKNP